MLRIFKAQLISTFIHDFIGIDPNSGKVLWEYKNWECHISCSSALEAGDNKLLVVGGYELGCVMIKVDKKADDTYTVTELFKHNDFGDPTQNWAPMALANF